MKKTLLTITLILTLTLTLLVLPVGAAEGEETSVEYYGRAALAECENATALLYAYDAISAGVAAGSTEINVYNGTDALSEEELHTVVDVHRRDRAEHFWMGNSYSFGASRGSAGEITTVTTLYPTYLFDGDALAVAKAEVEAEVAEILSGIEDTMTDYAKLVYLHDTLAGRIAYVTDAEHAHNLYGALVLGECVCEGYAEALQYLLHRVGIEAFLAIGSSMNPVTNTTEGHEWNYVKLNGEWYHVDLTWDDQDDELYHAYLAVTDATVGVDHIIDEVAYTLPSCTAVAYNYFEVEGVKLSAPYSVDELAAVMKTDGKRASVLVDDVSAFTSWYAENISDVAAECGVIGTFTYGYSSLGNEVKVYINDCKHTELTHVSAITEGCVTDGNVEHYLCGNCGKTFSDPLALDELSRDEVVISATGHSYVGTVESDEYIKDAGNCKVNVTYWNACEHCGKSAGTDALAGDKFYTGSEFGDHVMAEEWSSADGLHWHACTVDGCEHIADEGECSGGTATCLELAKCDICGAGYGELAEHSYDTESYGYKKPDGHAHTCTVCGTIAEVIAHASAEGGEATETTAELCEACGYIITPALNHGDNHEPGEEWLADADGHWHGCTGCEEQKLELAAHADEDGDMLCDVCGYAVEPSTEPDPIVDPLPELISRLTKEHFIWIGVAAAALVILALIIKLVTVAHRRRSRW